MSIEDQWLLSAAGGNVPRDVAEMAEAWRDIEARERAAGIPAGQPLLMSTHQIDYRLGDYFREAFSLDRMSTAMTYAKELRTWFMFVQARGTTWGDAERADVRAFQVWRVYDDRNPSSVSPATWNKGWAALNHFYSWAFERGWIEVNPLGRYDRLRDPGARSAHREKNARSSRDRWITPKNYAFWVRTGLMGYLTPLGADGRPEPSVQDPGSRARNIDRNRAFCDHILVTGLRLNEVGTLLVPELPTHVGQETPIVGKGRILRHYRPMHSIAIDSVSSYLRLGRARAVRRGRRDGRYANACAANTIHSIAHGRRGLRLQLGDGRVVDASGLSVAQRAALYRTTEAGPEPAWLWLKENGTPLPPAAWSKVFEAANNRISRPREVGGSGLSVRVTPHSLRFSFALFTLLAGIRATDFRSGLHPSTPFSAPTYGPVFDEVRDLLGHANTDITRNTYLEPVKSLRRTDFLRVDDVDAFWDSVTKFSRLVGFEEA